MQKFLIVLTATLLTEYAVAQQDGLYILKNEQPYVSPFDRIPAPAMPVPVIEDRPSLSPGQNITIQETLFSEERSMVDVTTLAPVERRVEAPIPPVTRSVQQRTTVRVKPEIASKKPVATPKETPAPSVAAPTMVENAKVKRASPTSPSINPTVQTSFSTSDSSANGTPFLTVSASAATMPTTIDSEPAATAPKPIVVSETVVEEKVGNLVVSASPIEGYNVHNEISFNVVDGLLKTFVFLLVGGLLLGGGYLVVCRNMKPRDPAYDKHWFHPVKMDYFPDRSLR